MARKYRQGMEGRQESRGRDENPEISRRRLLGYLIGGGVVGAVCLNDAINPHYKLSPKILNYFIHYWSRNENRWMNCKTELDSELEMRIQVLESAIEISKEHAFIPISKLSDFDKIRKKPYGYYELTGDINLKGIDFQPIGSYEQPFRGIFNGGGYKIINLRVKMPFTSISCASLFSYIKGYSIIYDLNLGNPEIVGGSCIGTIAGVNHGALRNCHISGGELRAYIGSDIGGIVGRNYSTNDFIGNNFSGIIEDCSITGISIANSTRIGGFVGYNNKGSLINPSFKGNIESGENQEIGALIGRNHDGGI